MKDLFSLVIVWLLFISIETVTVTAERHSKNVIFLRSGSLPLSERADADGVTTTPPSVSTSQTTTLNGRHSEASSNATSADDGDSNGDSISNDASENSESDSSSLESQDDVEIDINFNGENDIDIDIESNSELPIQDEVEGSDEYGTPDSSIEEESNSAVASGMNEIIDPEIEIEGSNEIIESEIEGSNDIDVSVTSSGAGVDINPLPTPIPDITPVIKDETTLPSAVSVSNDLQQEDLITANHCDDPIINSLIETYGEKIVYISTTMFPDVDILLCGTLHVAKSSSLMVTDVIKQLRPKFVVLELCEARADSLVINQPPMNVTLWEVVRSSYLDKSLKTLGMGMLAWMQSKAANLMGKVTYI